MSYPKWRHHPAKGSVIVYSQEQETSQCAEGWYDDRQLFPVDPPVVAVEVVSEAPKHRGGRPKKVAE